MYCTLFEWILCSDGDDIVIYKDKSRSEEIARMHGIRQQQENDVRFSPHFVLFLLFLESK